MSHTTTLVRGHTGDTATRGMGYRIHLLLGVAVLSAAVGALATTLLDRMAGATAAPQPAPLASSQPVVAVRGDTTVPEASAVFDGREVAPEEAASANPAVMADFMMRVACPMAGAPLRCAGAVWRRTPVRRRAW